MNNPFPKKVGFKTIPKTNNIQNKTNYNSIKYIPLTSNDSSPTPLIHHFLRTSSENILNNEYLIKNTGIPFGLNVTPFPNIDSSLIPQYSFGGGNGKPPRCSKCKAFFNPYCLIEGNNWKCNICQNANIINDIEVDNIQKILNNNNEVYEIFASSEYIENSPMSSNYVFILDTTNKSIANGSVKVFIEFIKYTVNNKIFINEERTFISFITFNSSGVSFYRIHKKNNSVEILEISGDEPFLPDSKKNLIFSVDDNIDNINAVIDTLDNLYNMNNIKDKNNINSDKLIFAIECGTSIAKKRRKINCAKFFD